RGGSALQFRGGRFREVRGAGMAPAGRARQEVRMIVFEGSLTPMVRAGEFEVASRRMAARAFPYAGEAGTARFRFDPAERRFLAPVPLADDGGVRRVAVEAASSASPDAVEGLFEGIHHGGSADELAEAQERLQEACARAGLATVAPRPVGLRESARNAAASARLEERAQAAHRDEHRAALLHAAARWIDESVRDLAAIAREGNFGKVFPFGEDIA